MFTKLEIRIEDKNDNNQLDNLTWIGGENFKVKRHSSTFFRKIEKTKSEILEIKDKIEQLVRELL